MSWTFVYLMLILKIPIVGLGWICWWAIHQTDEETPAESRDDGHRERRHPREPFPKTPRRGPHGDPAAVPPPRTRTPAPTVARGKSLPHD